MSDGAASGPPPASGAGAITDRAQLRRAIAHLIARLEQISGHPRETLHELLRVGELTVCVEILVENHYDDDHPLTGSDGALLLAIMTGLEFPDQDVEYARTYIATHGG